MSVISNTQIIKQYTLEDFKCTQEGRLLQIAKDTLNQHIKGVVKDVQTTDHFFIHGKILKCVDYVQCANRGCPLTSKQEHDYCSMILGLHHLAILKEISSTNVLEDKVSNDAVSDTVPPASDTVPSASDTVPSASTQSYKVLQWNFPQTGHIFKEVIDNFIKVKDEESLISLCKKLPTFAGCWFECLCFNHLRSSDKICVYYETVDDPTRKCLSLTYSQVSAIVDCSNLQRGILYETKAYYPIVDAIGCLTDNDRKHWLVFIQISLSKYENHKRKLSNLFKHHSHVKSRQSYYTYYRKTYNLDNKFQQALLLYVSPREQSTGHSDLLPKLKDEISHLTIKSLKRNLKFGVVSTDSHFIDQCKLAKYFPLYYASE